MGRLRSGDPDSNQGTITGRIYGTQDPEIIGDLLIKSSQGLDGGILLGKIIHSPAAERIMCRDDPSNSHMIDHPVVIIRVAAFLGIDEHKIKWGFASQSG